MSGMNYYREVYQKKYCQELFYLFFDIVNEKNVNRPVCILCNNVSIKMNICNVTYMKSDMTYSLFSVFHYILQESGMMFHKSVADQTAVVKGKAISVINTAIFAGQIGTTSSIGPVVDVTRDGNYLMLIPCVFAALTFCTIVCSNMPIVETKFNNNSHYYL